MASLIAASTSICVVTSSAVVGSSKTIRSGSEHSAIAVIDALQLAAGDLVREALADVFGVGQAELPEQRDRALLGLGALGDAVLQRRLDDLVHQPVRRD